MRKNFVGVFTSMSAFVLSAPAWAVGTDIDTLFGAVDVSSVKTNVLTIDTAIIGIALAMKGIGIVKRAVSKV